MTIWVRFFAGGGAFSTTEEAAAVSDASVGVLFVVASLGVDALTDAGLFPLGKLPLTVGVEDDSAAEGIDVTRGIMETASSIQISCV